MPIFTCVFSTLNWLTLTVRHIMHYFTSRLLFISLLGQKQVSDTGDEAVMKTHKKIKIGIPEMGTSSVILKYGQFEAEILRVIMSKIMDFHLTPKSTISGWALGDENVIGLRAFNSLLILLTEAGDWLESSTTVQVCKAVLRMSASYLNSVLHIKTTWILTVANLVRQH